MIDVAVGLGVTFSLIFNEIFGVSAGGIVVPGYIALQMHNGWMLVGTALVSFVAFGAVKLTSMFVFIYGRRRLVLSILFGFIFGYILRNYISGPLFELVDIRMQAIGYIIPGLIANWMERQGVFRTLSAVAIAASVVRLAVMIIGGGQIIG